LLTHISSTKLAAQIEQVKIQFFPLKNYEEKLATLQQIDCSLDNYTWLFTLAINLKSFWQDLIFPSIELIEVTGNSPLWIESRFNTLVEQLTLVVETVAISPEGERIESIERALRNASADVVEAARLSQFQQLLPRKDEAVLKHLHLGIALSQLGFEKSQHPIFLYERILDLNDDLGKQISWGNIRRARRLFDEISEIQYQIETSLTTVGSLSSQKVSS
jgi:hypothetical protein